MKRDGDSRSGDGSLATWKDLAAEAGPWFRCRVTLPSRRAGLSLVSRSGVPLLAAHLAETVDGAPSEPQLREFARILAMGRHAFTTFCLGHDDFRRGAARELAALGGPTCAPGTRADVEAFLLDHPVRRDDRDGLFRFAWAPVPVAPDRSGRFGDDNDPRFDLRWEAEKSADPSMAERCERWAGNRFLDGWAADDDGEEADRHSFDPLGEGWFVLCGWDGPQGGSHMGFRDLDGLGGFLRSLPEDELRRFHGLIANVDRDVAATDDAVSYFFAQMRGMCEDDWREEEQRGRLLPRRAATVGLSERSVPAFLPGTYGCRRLNRPAAHRGRRSPP